MTKEESIKVLTQYIDYDAETPDYYEMEKACKVAIKALEQEPILDKIRAEIEQEYLAEGHLSDYWDAIDKCLQIVDKYKAEKE